MKNKSSYDEIDSLSLLAHKVAPRVFDISSRQVNVSIRDQMVRAQQLVRDLRRADPAANRVLVIGMGVAGMTAALSACEAGFAQVCALDAAGQPFALFKGVHSRYVGPFMYEWPSSFHADQTYPTHDDTPWKSCASGLLAWQSNDPLSADDFGKALEASLKDRLQALADAGKSTPSMQVNIKRVAVQKYLKGYAHHGYLDWKASRDKTVSPGPRPTLDAKKLGGNAWGNPHGAQLPLLLEPDYIILAAGMGLETNKIPRVTHGQTPSFWRDDTLKDDGVANAHVVVLGGGDGAMQDALRSLTIFHHPLSFIRHLECTAEVKTLLHAELPELLSADRQMRQHNSWSSDVRGFAMVDAACKSAAERLAASPDVREEVRTTLRSGSGHVLLLVRGAHFDKAYLLNRFVAYLLDSCVNRLSASPHMGFSLEFGKQVIQHSAAGKTGANGSVKIRPTGGGKTQERRADHVVVRFGIAPKSIRGLQMVQLRDPNAPGADSRQRTTLSRVELPFVVM